MSIGDEMTSSYHLVLSSPLFTILPLFSPKCVTIEVFSKTNLAEAKTMIRGVFWKWCDHSDRTSL